MLWCWTLLHPRWPKEWRYRMIWSRDTLAALYYSIWPNSRYTLLAIGFYDSFRPVPATAKAFANLKQRGLLHYKILMFADHTSKLTPAKHACFAKNNYLNTQGFLAKSLKAKYKNLEPILFFISHIKPEFQFWDMFQHCQPMVKSRIESNWPKKAEV